MSEKKIGMQNERWNDVDGSASGEILKAFLDSESDGYAILQLKRLEENRDRSFESYDSLERQGLQPDINFYDTMYTGPITTQSPNTDVICENLFVKFNTDRPEKQPKLRNKLSEDRKRIVYAGRTGKIAGR